MRQITTRRAEKLAEKTALATLTGGRGVRSLYVGRLAETFK